MALKSLSKKIKFRFPGNSVQVHKRPKMEVNIYAVGPWLVSEIAHAAAPKQWLLCFVIHVPVATRRSPARDCFILVAAFTYYYYMDTWIQLQHCHCTTLHTASENITTCNMTLMKDLKNMFWDSSVVSWLMRNNDKIISMTLNNSENFINKEWRRIINAITKSSSQWCRLCTISMLMTRHEMKWKLI